MIPDQSEKIMGFLTPPYGVKKVDFKKDISILQSGDY